jgi:hypothetical protein
MTVSLTVLFNILFFIVGYLTIFTETDKLRSVKLWFIP